MKSRNVLTLLLAGISFSLAAQSPALLDVQVKICINTVQTQHLVAFYNSLIEGRKT